MAFSFKQTFPATWWVLASRGAHILYLCLLGAVALVLVGIHIDALVFRYRAERLLREIQVLPARGATFAEVQHVLDKYRKEAEVDGGCTLTRCQFTIWLNHLTWLPMPRRWDPEDYDQELIRRAMQRLGLRPAKVRADVVFRKGSLFSKGFDVLATTRDGPTELAGFGLVSRFGLEYSPAAIDSWSDDSYPNLVVIVWRGKWNAGTRFTPYATAAEMKKAMTMDLSCLSRWFLPCSYPEELVPGAVQLRQESEQYFAQHSEARDVWKTHTCPPAKLVRYGREFSNIAVLEVAHVHPPRPSANESVWEVEYRSGETLKGNLPAPWQHVTHYFDNRNPLLSDPSRVFAPGNKVIVFFFPYMRPQSCDCSVVPATEENLRAVKEGIAQDQQ